MIHAWRRSADISRIDHLTQKVAELRRIRQRDEAEIARLSQEVTRLKTKLRAVESQAFDDLPEPVAAVARAVRSEHLTYLGPRPLCELAAGVLDVEARGLPGLVVECGTALGGSAIVMAAAKAPDRELRVYDVFGQIPPPSNDDGADVHARYERIVAGKARGVGGGTYYGYRDDLLSQVEASFARHGVPVSESKVSLVEGLFQDTIVGDEPVALAHLDGDWYESTRTCLDRLAPRLVPGGRLVIDDYFAWSGCRKAVDEYLDEHPELRRESRSRLHLVRR
jgi:asparagine synthase (glutamine-hydrolysing)